MEIREDKGNGIQCVLSDLGRNHSTPERKRDDIRITEVLRRAYKRRLRPGSV
jgi:hypothetical protein